MQRKSHCYLIIFSFIHIMSTYSQETAREVLTRSTGMHVFGGQFQPGLHTVKSCLSACNGTCRAADFDSEGNTCWFHYDQSICSNLQPKPSCTHYKYIICERNTHILRGKFLDGINGFAACIDACVNDPECKAVDFNREFSSCWMHSLTACEPHKTKLSCDHLSIKNCTDVAAIPTILTEERGMHALSGTLQSASLNTPDACSSACAKSDSCSAVDFNFADGSCWFHSRETACSKLFGKPTCTHYKLEECDVMEPDPTTAPPDDIKDICGVPELFVSRIVGGTGAVPHSWPWMAGIYIDGVYRPVCGATLIGSSWVVTAAHCFSIAQDILRWTVRLGDHSLSRKDNFEVTSQVSQILIHPSYNRQTNDYDIALVKLSNDISIGGAIIPVCLPDGTTVFPAGQSCVITGWGVTNFETGTLPDVLQEASVPIIARDTCNQPDWYAGIVTSRMVCAGFAEGRKDSCQGDSGGPLVCRTENTWFLAGITSFGEQCARPKRPGVYTRITQLVDWINSNMNK